MKKTIEITKETAVKLLEILQDSEKEEVYKLFPELKPKKRWFDEYEVKGEFYVHKRQGEDYFTVDAVLESGYFKHYFIKEEQASQHAKQLSLFTEMQVFANFRNGDWVADFYNRYQEKYGLFIYKGSLKIQENYNYQFIFQISVKSLEIAEEMLDEFGDRIKECFNIK